MAGDGWDKPLREGKGQLAAEDGLPAYNAAAEGYGGNTRTSQHCPANTRIHISQGSTPKIDR